MKKYIGTRVILAEPTPPSVINGDREGYDIVYPDGLEV